MSFAVGRTPVRQQKAYAGTVRMARYPAWGAISSC